MENALSDMNHWAVIAAALSSFVLGGLWYSPILFLKVWQRATGLSDEQLASGHPAKIYGVSFILALLGAYVFAAFLGPAPGLGFATTVGLTAGLIWVAGSFGINYLFERKPLQLWLVNGGYHTAQYTLYGLILGAWH